MTDKIRESISALMDDEISEIELHRLLRQFSSAASEGTPRFENAEQKAIKESWISFQQIRTITKGEDSITTAQHLDLHARISAAIDEESIENSVTANISRQWKIPAVGFAVAASLVITLFVGQQISTDLPPDANTLAKTPISSTSGTTRKVIDAQTVSTAKNQATTISDLPTVATTGPTTFATNGDELEFQALDAEKQNRLREYLNRHERVTRKNPLSRTVVYPPKPTHN